MLIARNTTVNNMFNFPIHASLKMAYNHMIQPPPNKSNIVPPFYNRIYKWLNN